jgi:RNA:NAD 2'-phosphotransferase (TPT1/KptA family)
MIASNDKKRYAYKLTDRGISIAAVQGHSVEGIDAHGEVPMTFNNIPSEYAVHATTHDAWQRIRHEGLYPGRRLTSPFTANKRQDIHFATVLPENRMCRMGGLRENRPIWIFVENSALVRSNLEPRISFNGYVLTAHNVPPRLFACVLEIATSKDLQGGYKASDKILNLVNPCFQDPPREEYIDNTEELRRVASAHVEPLTQPSDLELIGEFFDVKRQAEDEPTAEQGASSSSMPSAQVEPEVHRDVPMPDVLGGTISSAGSEQIIVDAPVTALVEEKEASKSELVTEEPDWDADDNYE